MSEDTNSMPGADQLRAIIERIERVEEEMEGPKADRKEIYAEAKGSGYDTKAIRQIIKIRKMDRAKRQEEEAILDLYLTALGID